MQHNYLNYGILYLQVMDSKLSAYGIAEPSPSHRSFPAISFLQRFLVKSVTYGWQPLHNFSGCLMLTSCKLTCNFENQ